MRILKKDVDARLRVKVSRAMRSAEGYMSFGEDNDYPETMERLIKGSPTGLASFSMYSKFLAGEGFEESIINKVVVGRDGKGKNITVERILAHAARSYAAFQGFYLRTSSRFDANGRPEIFDISPVPFKKARFSASDDAGYSAFVYLKDWSNKDLKNIKSEARKYNVFNLDSDALIAESEAGATGVQIFHSFLDDEYFYPLSTFDSVYLSLDTEAQIQVFQNNTVRNGFLSKTAIGIPPIEDDHNREEFVKSMREQLGADGDGLLIYETEINEETGEIDANTALNISAIETKIDDKLFTSWEQQIKKNIRGAANNIPAILVDFENGSLGTTSGEAFTQSVAIYNALTKQDRTALGEALGEVLGQHAALKGVTNWKLKPLEL